MQAKFRYTDDQFHKGVRLLITTDLTREALVEIEKQQYDFLHLLYGDFSMMSKLPLENLTVKKLQAGQCKPQDFGWVSRLHNVEQLLLDQKLGSRTDLSKLVNLKYIAAIYGPPVLGLISQEIPLDGLTIKRFSDSFDVFSKTIKSSLKSLHVASGNITSLNGLEEFSSIEHLSLWNLRQLEDIAALEHCSKLVELDFYSCKNIDYKSTLPKLSKLKKLSFENQNLSSLDVIPKQNLKLLNLGDNTIIEDRNVGPLLEWPRLERAIFKKKKGYDYSGLEILEMLKKPK